MGKWWRLLALYNSETTAYTACVGAAATSPYTPDMSGRLKKLRVIASSDGATTLCNHVQFKLTCTKFTPNSIEVGGEGNGLQTAPAQRQIVEWDVDQQVQAGVPVTIEGRNVTADTPVGVSVLLYGEFEG